MHAEQEQVSLLTLFEADMEGKLAWMESKLVVSRLGPAPSESRDDILNHGGASMPAHHRCQEDAIIDLDVNTPMRHVKQQ
jgi:hypothetical protein